MRHRSIITAVLVAGTLTASAPASAQDLRSPDARDQTRQTSAGLDLRSPDAREVGDEAAARAAAGRRARDVSDFWDSPTADAYGEALDNLATASTGSAVPSGPAIPEDGGFDVRDASVGAIAAFALAGAGIALMGLRRRRVAAAIGG